MHIGWQTLLIIIGVGVVAGGLGVVAGGGDLLTYMLFGTVGAFLGDYVFAAFSIRLPVDHPILARIATAAIGALFLVVLARVFLRA